MPTASGFYSNTVIGKLRAPAQIIQWNISKVRPSGWRHIESGVYRPEAKIGWVGGFPAQGASGNALDFGQVEVENTGFWTPTVGLTFNLGEVNTHPSSFFVNATTVGTNLKAFNMKFWMPNKTVFTDVGYSPVFYYNTYWVWQSGIQMRDTTPGAAVVPSSLPASQNLYSKNNSIFVSGVFQDLEFSHYVYIAAQFPSGNYTLGNYGGLGSGNFTFRVTYDWTDINANTLSTDV